jgi:hypothetical protein
MTPSEPQHRPWWTEWGLLLVIGLPAITILACALTLGIAVKARDSVVSDDYYQRGLTINRSIERETLASQQGLAAVLWVDAKRNRLQVQLRRPAIPKAIAGEPEIIELQLVHPAHADRDQRLTLQHESDDLWFAPAQGLVNDPWDVVLESSHWRLSARQVRLGGDQKILMQPAPVNAR